MSGKNITVSRPSVQYKNWWFIRVNGNGERAHTYLRLPPTPEMAAQIMQTIQDLLDLRRKSE